jgi:hypothetical protein
MDTITADTITAAQIEELADEAHAAGHNDMEATCLDAAQDERGRCDEDRSAIRLARAICAKAINHARAQDDSAVRS